MNIQRVDPFTIIDDYYIAVIDWDSELIIARIISPMESDFVDVDLIYDELEADLRKIINS